MYVDDSDIPFVSIAISTHNRRGLLKDCLASIYGQDYPKPRFDVIIVDGGSTDGTEQLIEEFPQIACACTGGLCHHEDSRD